MKTNPNIFKFQPNEKSGLSEVHLQLVQKVKVFSLNNVKISAFIDMSVRLHNALLSNKITTFSDLTKMRLEEIRKLRGIGRKSFEELLNGLLNLLLINDFSDIEMIKENNNIDEVLKFNTFLLNLKESAEMKKISKSVDFLSNELPVRVINVLKRYNITTVEQLYSKDWNFFKSLSNFGKKSFSVFREYLYDKFEFSDEMTIKHNQEHSRSPFVNYEMLKNIPIDNDHILIELLSTEEVFNELSKYDVVTLEDLKNKNEDDNLFTDESIVYDYHFFKNIEEASRPYKDRINDSFRNFYNSLNYKHQIIIVLRLQGKTLEEIGSYLGVTRERIRQLILKVQSKYFNGIGSRILTWLKIYTNNATYITKKDLDSILGKYADTMTFLYGEMFDKSLNILILNKDYIDDVYEEINNLPKIIMMSEFEGKYEASFHKDLLKTYITKNYNILNDYAFKHKPTLVEKYSIVLDKYFDYIKIYDDNHISLFKKYYVQTFNDTSIYEKSNRAITGTFDRMSNLMMKDRGTYQIKHFSISDDLIMKIKETIMKHKSISFRRLFDFLKEDLFKQDIKNHYQLHGIVNKYLPNFMTNKDIVSIEDTFASSEFEIRNFIKKQEGFFTLKDLLKAIPTLSEVALGVYMSENDDIISTFNRRYIPSRCLKLSNSDKEQLKHHIETLLLKVELVTSQRILFEIFFDYFPNVMNENNIDNTHFAYQFMKYFYGKDFKFEFTAIWKSLDIALPQVEYIISKFNEKKIIKIKEITDFYKDNYIVIQNTKSLLDKFYDEGYLRIDEDTIIDSKILNFSNILINRIEEILIYSMRNNEISTSEIETYDVFPILNKVSWNKHLLAHLIKKYSERIYVIDIGNQYNALDYIFKEKENE